VWIVRCAVFAYDKTAIMVDWTACGRYILLPRMLDGVSPDESRDSLFHGNWTVDMNWDHLQAFECHTVKPWRREPRAQMYIGAHMDRLVPKMEMPTEVLSAPMLQDADTRPSKGFALEGGKSCSAASVSTAARHRRLRPFFFSGGTSSHCFPKALGFKPPQN